MYCLHWTTATVLRSECWISQTSSVRVVFCSALFTLSTHVSLHFTFRCVCPVTNPRLQTYTKGLTGWHVQLVTIYILVITCNTVKCLPAMGDCFISCLLKANQVLIVYFFIKWFTQFKIKSLSDHWALPSVFCFNMLIVHCHWDRIVTVVDSASFSYWRKI